MEKRRFLKRLRKALHGVPQGEIDNLLDYYSELIEDKYERGYSTREIFRDLKDPEDIAEEFRRENSYVKEDERPLPSDRDYGERRPRRRHRKPLWFYIVFSPFLLAFAIVGFALGLTFSIVGFVIVAVVAVCGVAFQIAGLYAICVSIPLFAVNAWIALVQVGVGVALIGLGNLLCLAIAPCWRAYASFIGWLFRGFRRSNKTRRERPRRVGKAVTAVVMCCLLVVGGIGGTIGFWQLGFDYKNLAVYDDYVKTEKTFDLDFVNLNVTGDNLYINIVRTEESQVKITYYESEDDKKSLTAENGTFTFSGEKTTVKSYFKNVAKRGLAFEALSYIYEGATVEIPKAFAGDIVCETGNGYVKIDGGEYGNVALKSSNGLIEVKNGTFNSLNVNTQNGLVSLEKTTAAVEISAETSNGLIELKEVAAPKVSAKTSNGAISLTKLKSDDITLTTDNGAINGSIDGVKADYTIDVKCNVGVCNLESGGDGAKKLYARVSNGAINVKFNG